MRPLTLLVALATACALALGGCGDDDGATAGNGTDRAFVAEMVPHHQGAIDMAEIARRRGEGPFVKGLAQDILRTQTEEISELRAQDADLAAAGIERGAAGGGPSAMVMSEDPAALETADPFDRAFLEMMLPHHTSALTMARVELAQGADPELKALAREIIDGQEREIRAMREQL